MAKCPLLIRKRYGRQRHDVKPCVRCLVTTTDQESGRQFGSEPLNTLAKFRNNPDLGGVTFGWNAIVVAAGAVRTGDPIHAAYRF